jgi:hypothetical protein
MLIRRLALGVLRHLSAILLVFGETREAEERDGDVVGTFMR